ncbi:integumentary mucin C.1-like [Ptychodera flava]|uniref:integumentary mucin C.1-like n=1 Tax=Ptychodera flava TaxID=63121 RepID=UPI00396AACDD
MTWYDADAYCQHNNLGRLVVIEKARECERVQDFTAEVTTKRVWIGLSDETTEGDFRTVHNQQAPYLDWANSEGDNEPDGSFSANCVDMHVDGRGFYDDSCDDTRPFVCKYPPVMTTQPPTTTATTTLATTQPPTTTATTTVATTTNTPTTDVTTDSAILTTVTPSTNQPLSTAPLTASTLATAMQGTTGGALFEEACNRSGYFKLKAEHRGAPGPVLDSVIVSSAIGCAQACLAVTACTSFNVKNGVFFSLRTCELFSEVYDLVQLSHRPGYSYFQSNK